MSKNTQDLIIVSEIAKEIAEESTASDQQPPSGTSQSQVTPPPKTEESLADKPSAKQRKQEKQSTKDLPTLSELERKKKNQNLEERKILLRILAILLGLQLLFMNAVVLGIVCWSLFDWDFFRDLDVNVLHSILDFTKYYVTAVLVELLSGIIYIVHRVFTNKE